MLEITYSPNNSEMLIAPTPSLCNEREALELLLNQVTQDKSCSTKVIDRETKHQILRSLMVRMSNLALVRRVPVSLIENGDSVYF
ncbi:MAG: hypothetical protein ACRC6M_13585 [Microcystaceae cyanobacterium]